MLTKRWPVPLVSFLLFGLFLIKLGNATEIRVVAERFPPFQSLQDGKIVGLTVDIAKALLRKTNHTATFEINPWARSYMIAQRQPNTMLLSVSRSKKREHMFKWVGKISESTVYFWRKKNRQEIQLHSINDIVNYSVSVQRGGHHHEYLAQRFDKYHRSMAIATTRRQSIQMFYNNRADLILGNAITLPLRIKAAGLDPNEIEPILSATEISPALHLAFSKQTDTALVNQFTQAYQELVQTGELDKLKQKWMPNYHVGL